jgi:uncharacterized protein (TIGR00290 family)
MANLRAFLSWSSGKDSAFALLRARAAGIDVAGVLTNVSEADGRVAMHGAHPHLLAAQVAALGLPAVRVQLPWPCPNAEYERRTGAAFEMIKSEGIRHIVFGDLFLEDIRAYRDTQMAEAEMEPIYPLWKQDTANLAREMIAQGLVAHLVCVDGRKLDESFAGRKFDENLLRDLPPGIDPCGENGEFHTLVTEAPFFSRPVPFRRGEVTRKGDFIYADLLPV